MSSGVFTLPYHFHILPLCLGPDLFLSLIYTHCNSVAHVNLTMPSLDSIPSGILLWGNATMVYLCACGFFVNVRITIRAFLASLLGTHELSKDVKNADKQIWRRYWGYKPSDDVKKCQHVGPYACRSLVDTCFNHQHCSLKEMWSFH
jgi:hypothetical protein